jgi:hypothetical protein
MNSRSNAIGIGEARIAKKEKENVEETRGKREIGRVFLPPFVGGSRSWSSSLSSTESREPTTH